MEGILTIESPKSQVVKITISRPSSLNSLNSKVFKELDQLLTTLLKQEEDPKHRVKVLIITGAGEKSFVAGADVKEFLEFDEKAIEDYLSLAHRVMLKLSKFPAPTIAAVNGYCLGGGLELALCCDFILATKDSSFGFPEVNLGLIPGFGGTQRALRRLNLSMLKELIYFGKKINSSDAEKIGLIDQVYEKGALNESVLNFIIPLLELPDLAIREAKLAVFTQYENLEREGLSQEQESFKKVFLSKDGIEGRTAFSENRKPFFKGE
jgi:enoyl-CoA hydratase